MLVDGWNLFAIKALDLLLVSPPAKRWSLLLYDSTHSSVQYNGASCSNPVQPPVGQPEPGPDWTEAVVVNNIKIYKKEILPQWRRNVFCGCSLMKR